MKVVAAANYYNAGTVEFLVDKNRQFYFLEMNTRLQVEHPITEMVTGVDLVQQQIRVALGEKLQLQQEDIVMRGSAIECRIYAEDPNNNFFPSPGRITLLRTPSGPGIRDDSGVYEGWTVPIDYDPLISKLVAWGATRDDAIARMKRALREYHLEGIRTNIAFFTEILETPGLRKGDFDTGYIDQWLRTRDTKANISDVDRDLALLAAVFHHANRAAAPSNSSPAGAASAWKQAGRTGGLRTS